ncbi:MAG: hypothetical protein CBC66_000580 [Candidatus Pelagibacter sp. TMED106]|nr:MAG: hypothetical protein CBC66_000580 [Candidatus Pelagibacter sp. TMED106]|tara:strand:+ start:4397 stop:4840 length:444 start_codon:yes stop_codon:yes gene_type:complete
MKNIILTLLLFLTSCGYNPIFLNNQVNFAINEIKLENKNQISYKIKNSLNKYVNLSKKPRAIDIEIASNRDIKITSKDQKGNAKTFDLIISVIIIITENNINTEKEFKRSFSYQTKSNKFELKNYENTIQDNLTNKIILDIDKFLMK